MKKTIIVGNIGNPAVCREATGGHKFVSFSVAYSEREKKDAAGVVLKDEAGHPVTEALWAECEIYVKPENSANNLLKLFTKGRHIYVEAFERVEAWINKSGEAQGRILYKVQNFEV